LDSQGYAVLADFGLSKDNFVESSLTNSFCGTIEYIAPEIIKKRKYGKACDWWSFGCVLFEMLTGLPPFYDKNRNLIMNKIVNDRVCFSENISCSAQDIIIKLLCKDPNNRLGSVRGAEYIKKHEFFDCIDWELLEKKRLIAPYIPMLDSRDDIKHFDIKGLKLSPESPNGFMNLVKDD
jgi:serine/threonine protein kinase